MKAKAFPYSTDPLKPFSADEIMLISSDGRYALSADEIEFTNMVLVLVCSLYQVSVKEVLSKSRELVPKAARSLFVYYILSRTDMLYETAGAFIGGRDHTSVRYQMTIHDLILNDPDECEGRKYALYKLMQKVPRPYAKRCEHIADLRRYEWEIQEKLDLKNAA